MRILVDADDVLWPLLDLWLKALNKKYGTNVQTTDIKQWDLEPYFPMLSTAQIMEVLDEEDFWQNIRPKDDAIYYLKKLTEEQHEIYIVSATYYKSIPYKIKLIEEYFPFICTYKNIIFTRNKSMIIGDVLVDDGYHNLKTFTSGKRVLLRAPSNQYYNIKELEIDRFCIDWSEVYQYIQELNEVTN